MDAASALSAPDRGGGVRRSRPSRRRETREAASVPVGSGCGVGAGRGRSSGAGSSRSVGAERGRRRAEGHIGGSATFRRRWSKTMTERSEESAECSWAVTGSSVGDVSKAGGAGSGRREPAGAASRGGSAQRARPRRRRGRVHRDGADGTGDPRFRVQHRHQRKHVPAAVPRFGYGGGSEVRRWWAELLMGGVGFQGGSGSMACDWVNETRASIMESNIQVPRSSGPVGALLILSCTPRATPVRRGQISVFSFFPALRPRGRPWRPPPPAQAPAEAPRPAQAPAPAAASPHQTGACGALPLLQRGAHGAPPPRRERGSYRVKRAVASQPRPPSSTARLQKSLRPPRPGARAEVPPKYM